MLEFLKRKTESDIWDKLVDINDDKLPESTDFIKACREIYENPAFELVVKDIINGRLKDSIKQTINRSDFDLKLAAILGVEGVRERFKQLSERKPEIKQEFNKFAPL